MKKAGLIVSILFSYALCTLTPFSANADAFKSPVTFNIVDSDLFETPFRAMMQQLKLVIIDVTSNQGCTIADKDYHESITLKKEFWYPVPSGKVDATALCPVKRSFIVNYDRENLATSKFYSIKVKDELDRLFKIYKYKNTDLISNP